MRYQVVGTEITRTSDREYTHAVIRKGQTTGKAWAFAKSYDLALKAKRTHENYNEGYEFEVKEVIKL